MVKDRGSAMADIAESSVGLVVLRGEGEDERQGGPVTTRTYIQRIETNEVRS